MASLWDLTALVNAADPKASQAERHLWLVRLMEWLRQAPRSAIAGTVSSGDERRTPLPLLRLRHLLNQIERQPGLRDKIHGLAHTFWRDIDAASLFADFGFGTRLSFGSELAARLHQRLLPGTPDTPDLGSLFGLLFQPEDRHWLETLDEDTFGRVVLIFGPEPKIAVRALLDAVDILVSVVHADGYSPALRQRMDADRLRDEPFRQLSAAAAALRHAIVEGRQAETLHAASYLRALLGACQAAADSVMPHLDEYGVSVNIVFNLDQMRGRIRRIEQLLNCLIAQQPLRESRLLLLQLIESLAELHGLRPLLARHYSLLARHVAERSAEAGQQYITRNRVEYREMLRRAVGGGMVIAGTTFVKFGVTALAMSAFWTGFWLGINYALSFVIVMLLHWTVATKQPAMTAPAMAASLPVGGGSTDAEIETFVDRVAQLIRSQVAGILGNVAMCGPLVMLVQTLAILLSGSPLVGEQHAPHILDSLSLLGPTAFFAAFTGVLLFGSSLFAGWLENWFVFHRLDSAIEWNPRIVAVLGAARARRWSRWWRANISGLAANVSLGMLLGLVPAVALFFGLPIEVRHVTLSTGQLAAALGALGWPLLLEPAFWWCLCGIAATGILNVSISFWLAFKVALRSRGVRLNDRDRIRLALRQRLRRDPLSFLRPPAERAGASAV